MSYTKAEAITVVRKTAEKYQTDRLGTTGPLVCLFGKLNSKTKCTADYAWIKSIWALFYTRATTINAWATEPQNLDDSMVDFSSCGEPTYSFMELLVEFNSIT